jgi:hypothetical protein
LVALLNQQIVRQHDLLHHLGRNFRCPDTDFFKGSQVLKWWKK